MKIIKMLSLCFHLCFLSALCAQNVGIGVNEPVEKLDVGGKVKANAIILNDGGNQHDFLIKNTLTGEVGFKKAQGGLGLSYIICMSGSWPSAGASQPTEPFLGEIKLFAGNYAPYGWALCQGQLLSIAQNTALFAILGTTYGGNGQTTFALPDLRGTTAIGSGTAMPAGYQWTLGEREN